jgi:sporulation protein YlmC with PRC-barrel domain
VARAASSVVSVSDHADLRALVQHEEKLIGKNVYTETGDDQGSISDIYFEERTGAVVGYEVSGGLIGDMASGTSYLPSDEITTIGPDVVYVRPETAGALESQVGGVRGALKGAGDKLGEATDTAEERIGEARQAGSERAGEARPEESLIGKRTGSDVEDADGSVLVPKGRRIRPEDVEAVRARGKLPALTASVAMGGAQAAGETAKGALGEAADSAGSLWDQFTRKIGEVTDASGRRVDEEQTKRRLAEIEDAVGRPVTKVILDREDNVVLDLGDIISHGAIQRAHESGGLDSLLASVYKGTVEFSKEEMRVRVEAEATVDKSSGGATVVEELERKVEDAEKERQAEKERKQAEADAGRKDRDQVRDERRRDRQTVRAERIADVEPAGTADEGTAVPSGPPVRVRPTGTRAGSR